MTYQPKKTVGRKLREIRTGRGLSQEALGHAIGFERNYIGRLERGEGNPTLGTLSNLADRLGIHILEFFLPDEQDLESDPTLHQLLMERGIAEDNAPHQ